MKKNVPPNLLNFSGTCLKYLRFESALCEDFIKKRKQASCKKCCLSRGFEKISTLVI